MIKLTQPDQLVSYCEKLQTEHKQDARCIAVCGGTGCRANRGTEVAQAFRRILDKEKLDQEVEVRLTGCHGFCEKGPLVVLLPQGTLYVSVTPDDVEEIVTTSVKNAEIVERLTYKIPGTKERIPRESDIPFYANQQRIVFGKSGYANQQRIVFGKSGKIDPANIDDYIAAGGYTALAKVLTSMKPEEIIDSIEKAGLRGRGGGGFVTARKWQACRQAEGSPKYVLCNGDEGDPGAFMDRSIMEGNPHAVLEGMTIGAYAIGSNHGYIYVRLEYPLAVENLQIAIKQAEEKGLLGENILGTGFDFKIRISRGA
ncbi:MAG: (2Fe-2S) ferredoxin domain-containing protein, partial [Planctomycetota bacterium]